MSIKSANLQIREMAERIAVSHGLEVVDLEFQGGGGKHRTLRVFLERNAEGRAALAERLAALRAEPAVSAAETGDADAAEGETPSRDAADETAGEIVLDLVDAGEAAGLTEDEDELAYLRHLPEGVPVAQLSGITHGDCERFARDFGVALDVEDVVPGAEYMLEVSSPGLDRKLTRPDEFARFVGQLVKLQTFTPVAGNRHWRGRLTGADGAAITLEPVAEKASKKKGAKPFPAGAVEISLNNIEKAQIQPEF